MGAKIRQKMGSKMGPKMRPKMKPAMKQKMKSEMKSEILPGALTERRVIIQTKSRRTGTTRTATIWELNFI